MNLNATLFIQCLVFFCLAWFTKRFVWPPLVKALDERTEKIARGLADSEAAGLRLSDAQTKAAACIKQANDLAREKTDQAEKKANEILSQARTEAQSIVSEARLAAAREAEQAKRRAQESLAADFSALVIEATRAVLQKNVDLSMHQDVLEQMQKNWSTHAK